MNEKMKAFSIFFIAAIKNFTLGPSDPFYEDDNASVAKSLLLGKWNIILNIAITFINFILG